MIRATLLNGRTTTGAGDTVGLDGDSRTYFATLTGTSGALAATVDLEVSNDGGAHWDVAATFTLNVATWSSAANDAVDSVAVIHAYDSVRANVRSISGTGASVSMLVASKG